MIEKILIVALKYSYGKKEFGPSINEGAIENSFKKLGIKTKTVWIDEHEKEFLNEQKYKKTGLAAIFTASLELTKDGVIDMMQKNLFGEVLIRTAKHTPMKLKGK